jgi:dihydroorotase
LLYLLSKAVALAKKQGTLHIFHLSTAKEMDLFTNKIHWNKRKLPKFVYTIYGLPMMIMPLRGLIKWNPAVKQQMTKSAMGSFIGRKAKQPYLKAPSGSGGSTYAV